MDTDWLGEGADEKRECEGAGRGWHRTGSGAGKVCAVRPGSRMFCAYTRHCQRLGAWRGAATGVITPGVGSREAG